MNDDHRTIRQGPITPDHSAAVLSRPWREDSGPRLLWGSESFLPALFDAIDRARSRIEIEMYLCESGGLFQRFLEALSSAHARGVKVRMLLDAVGSAGLRDSDRRRLRRMGVELRIFNPIHFGHNIQALVRDHRKLIVIDDALAFVGGMCISDEYDPALSGADTWLDAMVEVRGAVVEDSRALFEQSWELAARGRIRDPLRWRLRTDLAATPNVDEREAGARVRLCASRGGRHNPLLVTLVRRVRRARHQVWLCTPYFFPSRALIRVLRNAALRGVSVTLNLPGPISDHPAARTAGQYYYQQLLDAGVRILEFQPRFIHLKAARVDDWITIGSSNYDRWNLHWNLEANLEIIDSAMSRALDARRRELNEQSVAVTREAWMRRGTWQRWRERFWHWVGTRVHRWLNWIRKRRA